MENFDSGAEVVFAKGYWWVDNFRQKPLGRIKISWDIVRTSLAASNGFATSPFSVLIIVRPNIFSTCSQVLGDNLGIKILFEQAPYKITEASALP